MLARLRLFAVTWLFIAILAGVLPAVEPPSSALGPKVVSEGAFGPQLFLLSPDAGEIAALSTLPGAVHAILYVDGSERYLASGEAILPIDAAAAGIPTEMLDADTTGKAYYFVDAQAAGAEAAAVRFGQILYADSRQLVLAVPSQSEPALLDALPAAGISLVLIPADPMPLAEQPRTAASAALPAAGDPAIERMLSQVTAPAISGFIADLSGERPVDIGGASITLATRYTFSSAIRNAEKYLSQRYIELGIPVSYASWTYGSYSGRNVVAELRGTVNPERIWLVGGHFDDTSESPYSLAPGADDNASGSAATLALAGILSQGSYRDTIRFVHFSGEEQGHWGSIMYVRSLYAAGAQVMGFIDLDMIGWDSDGDRALEVHSGTRANSIDLAGRFTSANQRYNQGLQMEIKQSSASRFSDHSSFWDYGYASFMAIENFFADAIANDRNPWYHNTGDRLARVNLDYVVRTARTTLAVLAEAAGLRTGPTPTLTAGPTATPTYPAPTPACAELVINGGFEAASGWTFAATANPGGYSTAQAHTGARSARLGVVPVAGSTSGANPASAAPAGVQRNLLGELAPDGASYSTAYQTITIPADAPTASLAFWMRPGAESTGGTGDYQRVLLLKPGAYSYLASVVKTLAHATTWQRVTYDLTPYRGQSLVLYFEVYNDNTAAAPRTWLYVDDVSVLPCAPQVTPALTSTPPSPTPTRTPEPATLTPQPTSTPTATATSAPTATPTMPPVAACTEHVINGGFEGDSGWTFARTANPGGYTAAIAHSGLRAGRLGVVAGTGAAAGGRLTALSETDLTNLLGERAAAGASYSTAYQTMALPADADTITLSFWQRPGTGATSGSGDFQRVLLLRPGTYAVVKTLTKMLAHSDQWQQARFDLTAYRGQSLVLYFEVYNDDISAGPRTWMYVDDVRSEACKRMTGATGPGTGGSIYLPLLVSPEE